MASKQGHKSLADWDPLHHKAGTFDGGKCLGRHEAYYDQRNSCSYRWQAVKRAFGEDKSIYNSHSNKAMRLSGTGHRTPAARTAGKYNSGGALISMGVIRTIAREATEKNKSLTRDVRYVEAKAFRTGFAPYPNQAHHLLPDAVLREGVFETTEDAPNVRDLIFQDLLTNKYNLNHWTNMMILPCAKKHGSNIGLPTHPNGHNHPTYSLEVKAKVKKALLPYKGAIDDEKQKKPHTLPASKNVKDDFDAIAVGLHALVVAKRAIVQASATEVQMNDFHPDVASATGF